MVLADCIFICIEFNNMILFKCYYIVFKLYMLKIMQIIQIMGFYNNIKIMLIIISKLYVYDSLIRIKVFLSLLFRSFYIIKIRNYEDLRKQSNMIRILYIINVYSCYLRVLSLCKF